MIMIKYHNTTNTIIVYKIRRAGASAEHRVCRCVVFNVEFVCCVFVCLSRKYINTQLLNIHMYVCVYTYIYTCIYTN